MTSLLDMDLYKFSGQQFFFTHFRNAIFGYKPSRNIIYGNKRKSITGIGA